MPKGANAERRKCRTARNAERREMPNGANAEQRGMPNGAKCRTARNAGLRRPDEGSGRTADEAHRFSSRPPGGHRTCRRISRGAEAASIARAPAPFTAVWHDAQFGIRRCSAFAPFGICAVRHLRRSAFAPFGISRRSAFAPFGICAVRHSRPSAFRALRIPRSFGIRAVRHFAPFGISRRSAFRAVRHFAPLGSA